MLSESKIAFISHLLTTGKPDRRIAEMANVSHGTVAAIRSGKRVEKPAHEPSQNYPFPMTFETVRARAREMLIRNGRQTRFGDEP